MKKNYAEMSTEDLKKSIKTSTFVSGLLGGALLFSLILNIFINKKSIWDSIITPLCLLPILLVVYQPMKEMKKELKSREI
jgi:hypothetical protein